MLTRTRIVAVRPRLASELEVVTAKPAGFAVEVGADVVLLVSALPVKLETVMEASAGLAPAFISSLFMEALKLVLSFSITVAFL